MGPDGIEIEVDRSEEDIRADRAENVKNYFDAKKNGEEFTPKEVATTRRVPISREIERSYDRVEHYIKEKDCYTEDVSNTLKRFDMFMKLFTM